MHCGVTKKQKKGMINMRKRMYKKVGIGILAFTMIFSVKLGVFPVSVSAEENIFNETVVAQNDENVPLNDFVIDEDTVVNDDDSKNNVDLNTENEAENQQFIEDKIVFNKNDVNGNSNGMSDKIITNEQLQELINNSTEEIELEIENLEISKTITIPSGKKIILGGNGVITKEESSDITSFFEVNENSELTIQDNIVVDGNKSKITGINVKEGGMLTIKDNVSITYFCSDNWTESPIKIDGGALIMDGGNVHDNHLNETSAIKVEDGEMKMISGSVSNNTSVDYTPGIYLSNSTMTMGDGNSNPIIEKNILESGSSVGGGLCVSASIFTMYSGTITENKGVNGGGIGVIYGEDCNTEIIKGIISNNWAIMGGGMHITEGGSNVVMKNSAIYDNSTFSYLTHDNGGGVWFCPQGSGKFYTTNGSAIINNIAGGAGDDITIDDLGIMPGPSDPSHREASVKLSKRTFTGVAVTYYKDEINNRYKNGFREVAQEDYFDGSQRAELHSQIDEKKSIDKIIKTADVLIYGNEAAIGGGISCNGTLTIGDEGKDKTINIEKAWNDTGNEDKRPNEIRVILLQNGIELDSVILSETNGWKATFDELPAYDKNQIDYQYDIKEEVVGDYEVTKSSNERDNTINFILENKFVEPKTGNLTIAKEVTGTHGDKDKEFHFNITLDNKNINCAYNDILFENGIAKVTLKHGEKVTVTGLPAGTGYTVTEVEANQDGYITSSKNEKGKIEKDVVIEVEFVNEKNAYGNLSVTKEVKGNGGEQNKEFHFIITLSDKTITGIYGEMEFVDGVAKITLKHGETAIAERLPSDISYSIVENEANEDGYKTSSKNDKGKIIENKTLEVIFTNEKNITSNKPEEPNTDKSNSDKGSPETGDQTNVGLFTAMFTMSTLILVVLVVLKKKRALEHK